MEFFKFLHFFTFLSLAVLAASQADLDAYWKSQLPNTRMPKAVRDLLHNEWFEDKGVSVGVGKGGVNVNTGKGTTVGVGGDGVNVNSGKGTTVGVRKGGGVNVNTGKGTHVGVGHGGVGVKAGKGTNVGVGKGGVVVNTGHQGHPVYVGVTPSHNPFDYEYAATKDQLRDDPNVALFFLEKDLHRGKAMNLRFTKSPAAVGFLPRKAADSIPFSSESLPGILSRFGLEPGSAEAKAMEKTIKTCENPTTIKGEDKYCATSLESMVDYSISKLGKEVKAISTQVQSRTESLQKYTIADAKKANHDDKAVVCHRQNYPYAVFYCHSTQTTEAYEVDLVGADGKSKAKAVAICHKETGGWNPKHLAFQVLKVKPGTVPVCHFLPEDHVVWVSN